MVHSHFLRIRGLPRHFSSAPSISRAPSPHLRQPASPERGSASRLSRVPPQPDPLDIPGPYPPLRFPKFFDDLTEHSAPSSLVLNPTSQLSWVSSHPASDWLYWLNAMLLNSVQKEQYAAAERIRLRMRHECAPIEPHIAYERASLEQIRWHGNMKLDKFHAWLCLVPDNVNPSRVVGGPFTKTRNMLFHTGNPARSLLLVTEFSLAVAEKGYGQLLWGDLVRLMARHQLPEKAIQFFLSFEAATLRYYTKHHPGRVEEIANLHRYRLIMLCCDVGWIDEAVQLVQDSPTHYIKQARDRLIQILRAQNDLARVAIVENSRKRLETIPAAEIESDPPKKLSAAQRIAHLFGISSEVLKAPRPLQPFYSTRATIEGSENLRPRSWVASELRQVKRLISQRSLVSHRSPGKRLHSFMAQYDACNSYPRGLSVLRKRALAASDPCSYTWLCKEMFYLHEAQKWSDILALFCANFETHFLPPEPWRVIWATAEPSDPLRTAHTVPRKHRMSPTDAWVVWKALVRLAVYLPSPLPVLAALRHSAVHYASKLTDRQFRAFPTSYTAVFRSIIWAYGELKEVRRAVSTAGDMTLIGKTHESNVGLLDELTVVHILAGDNAAAMDLLGSLEQLGPRLATYGLMMNAYLRQGQVDRASELELRMKENCEYIPGANWRMDATLAALRTAENARDGPLLLDDPF